MDTQKKLEAFWDQFFEGAEPDKVDEKWIEDPVFNEMMEKYIPEEGKVLDYGCGDGWALFEIANTKKLGSGLGIDTSVKGVSLANACAKMSGLDHILFEAGDSRLLEGVLDEYDFAISINVLDVVQDQIVESILQAIQKALKPGGYFVMGINPEFPKEKLEELGYTFDGTELYKDGILRGNEKSKDQWTEFLSKYFEVVDYQLFALAEREKQYPRRMFVCRK